MGGGDDLSSTATDHQSVVGRTRGIPGFKAIPGSVDVWSLFLRNDSLVRLQGYSGKKEERSSDRFSWVLQTHRGEDVDSASESTLDRLVTSMALSCAEERDAEGKASGSITVRSSAVRAEIGNPRWDPRFT